MNQYECIVHHKGYQLHLNVFACNKEGLKNKAIDRAVEYYKEFGKSVNREDIKPIGFIDKGLL